MIDNIKIVNNVTFEKASFINNISEASSTHLNYVLSATDIERTSGLYFGEELVALFFLQDKGGYYTGAVLNSKSFFESKRMVAKSKRIIYNFFKEFKKPVYLLSDKKEYNSWFKHSSFINVGKTSTGEVFLWQEQQ